MHFISLILLLVSYVYSQEEIRLNGADGTGKGSKPPQKEALLSWTASLTEDDESPEYWLNHINFNPPQIFDHFIVRLSKTFERYGATLNFVSVGACDGTNDFTISQRFLKSPHWDAIFVEPMSNNYRDLVQGLKNASAFHRSFALRAAATDVCTKPTITVTRPLWEDMGHHHSPHWLRRQIGRIKDPSETVKADWGTEQVRCVTGREIMEVWNQATKGDFVEGLQTDFDPAHEPHAERVAVGPLGKKVRRRPHILKVDVEGHDYAVLSSFLNTTASAALPLLISYEAKSLGKKYPLMMDLLGRRGYSVSDFRNKDGNTRNDGFALLRHTHVLPRKRAAQVDWRAELEAAAAQVP